MRLTCPQRLRLYIQNPLSILRDCGHPLQNAEQVEQACQQDTAHLHGRHNIHVGEVLGSRSGMSAAAVKK